MYSVVLLVALTGGEATPAWGKCSGSGCWVNKTIRSKVAFPPAPQRRSHWR